MKRFLGCGVMVLALLAVAPSADASTIDFENLQDRASFLTWGIHTNYQGYEWGYGNGPGPSNAIIPTDITTGWGSMTATNPAVGNMPTGGSGTASAWNWNGSRSLWIDFGDATDFVSGLFAVLSQGYNLNATSIQLFGYDASDVQVASSSVLVLTDTFQQLTANFSGIYSLEIRGNAISSGLGQFSVDDLVINSSPIPEPSTILLLSTGLVGLLGYGWRRKQQGVA